LTTTGLLHCQSAPLPYPIVVVCTYLYQFDIPCFHFFRLPVFDKTVAFPEKEYFAEEETVFDPFF